MEVGTRIRRLMRERGLTQKELAADLELSPSALGNYIRGERRPPPSVLMNIAAYFGVSVDFLLGAKAEGAADARENELLQMYRILGEEQQEVLLQQARFWVAKRA